MKLYNIIWTDNTGYASYWEEIIFGTFEDVDNYCKNKAQQENINYFYNNDYIED